MVNRLKNVGLIFGWLLLSVTTFGQLTNAVTNNTSSSVDFASNYRASNTFTQPSFRTGSSAFRGGNSMAMVETFMRQLNLKMPPTGYRFASSSGVNFQAGLLMNSRQPKLGASFSMPRGFNFSAGYGINGNSLMRQGLPTGRNAGIQFTASYRLFKKR